MHHDDSADPTAGEARVWAPVRGWRPWSWLNALALQVAVAVIALACLFPFHAVAVASLQSVSAVFGLSGWPVTPSFATCLELLAHAVAEPGARNLMGALGTGAMGLAVSLFLGSTADYAFGRASLRSRVPALGSIAVSMLPQVVILSCMFELMRGMHLYNHWWGLALPYMVFTVPFAVWAVAAFGDPHARSNPGDADGFDGVEASADPAVGTDPRLGSAAWKALWPALLMAAFIAFIAAWNEFMYSLAAVLDHTQRPHPVAEALGRGARPDASWAAFVVLAALAAAALWRTRSRQGQ